MFLRKLSAIWGIVTLLSFSVSYAQTVSLLDEVRSKFANKSGIKMSLSFYHQSGNMVFTGDLTQERVNFLITLMEKHPQAKTLYVDSDEGEPQAVQILLNKMQAKKMSLVVDGRCFSVCAAVLFLGVDAKKVLPNSLLVLNGYQKQGNELAVPSEVKKVDPNARAFEMLYQPGLAIPSKDIRSFYAPFNIKTDALERFQYLASEKTSCPSIEGWALSATDLSQLNVRGVQEFWFPKSQKERAAVLAKLGVQANKVFFGDIYKLSEKCVK